ncbi:TPA: type II toxin-antitoxin system VapC family toxin [Mannheimia haemolytica]|uniref:tRNA(fMet)-specific endonuclease VapC n=1 Tax=Mannheimia haemolytica TaxID=75985 RepID=A0A378NBZ4_MANHA|nr:type II toxin-antitoxin system VapC family toxin [Mannheimia haemolytica]AGQ39324.1 twitching motility protein PilT [Mannheimia haemolytica D171]KYL22166.1 twitching motility protein PilT [Mannheimia haemolytica]MDW0534599.1 type II toxin-antitoxin system VapC family toxin [Mannheimia haemolytica]MDW0537320.1 type II toxin-antitoxin system VapC family toxin [Mannheimia haemolytica]MDW0544799.1 type II toxin-antitoxin system VapC family toxin [Mannheimia haemolytica]
MYMLDTNTVSYFFRGNANVVAKLKSINPERLCISSVTAAELVYGVAKRNNGQLSQFLGYFLSSVKVLDWNYRCAELYGKLRAEMEKNGKVMGVQDQMIASHALAEECILVSSDQAFKMVPDLKLENWLH